MSIVVTKPVGAPTNLNAVVSAGGSLAASTQYYYIVIANDISNGNASGSALTPHHSDISEEGSFITTGVNKSVTITWDNPTGGAYYNVLLSTISGNYVGVPAYGNGGYETWGNITDGAVGISISAILSNTYCRHSIQLANLMHPSFTNDLGVIHVALSGTDTHDLQDVYDAVVAAGLSDYIDYDGYDFIIKGWIFSDSSDVGYLTVTRQRITMLKGGIKNLGTGYQFTFGKWSGAIGASKTDGCSIDLQSARYPLLGAYEYGLRVYGCLVSTAHSRNLTIAEMYGSIFYNGGANLYIAYKVSELKDNIIIPARNDSSDVYDTAWGQGNNFSKYKHVRLKIWQAASMPYDVDGTFYDCDFLTSPPLNIYSFTPTDGHYADFYDCRFSEYSNGVVSDGEVRYRKNTPPYTSDNYLQFNSSFKIEILDKNGDPIQGATINAVDKNGDPAVWIEHSGDDRIVTGSTYTADRTTDADGKIDYYLQAYKFILDPDNTDGVYSYNTIRTDLSPYTFTFSKDGYQDYVVKIDMSGAVNTVAAMSLLDDIIILGEIDGSIEIQELAGSLDTQELEGSIDITELAGTMID